ncbi:aminoglycoside adenylyltransferase domain-containing protein [Devosia sp.]|uniref:aminoglycoside adenylyltransferase domain-containing protein n=1 Tax=Devosia sp. TaxID=1871048 RepID=UPI003264C81D
MQEIDAALGPFLGEVITRDPTLLIGFHLVGSIAQGDFHLHASDIDFVAVLSRTPSRADLDGLAAAHRTYSARPNVPLLDGIWVTAPDLTGGPDGLPDGPTTQDSHFIAAGQGNRNPVTWLMLRDQSRSMLGTIDRDSLWNDPARLTDWLRQNADTYWRSWYVRSSNLLSRSGLAMLGSRAPMWGVLGISRQHYTLATGQITSKSGAGRYARDAFDQQWRPIIDECLAARAGASGSLYRNPFARRRDALAFMATAVEAVVNYPARVAHPTSE